MLFGPLRNQKGSAILFSVFLMSLLMFIALEISKDTVVEYQGSLNNVKRVQAYYAAKACTDLSLLRIKAYQQAARSIGKNLPDTSMLDIIWQFPLSWPLVAPAEISASTQSDVKKANNQSYFKHKFSSQINSESSRIDINDLISPSEGIREKTRQQILDLFQAKLREQNAWSKKYYNYRFEDLINHITDWIDADRISLMGGDEGSHYQDMRSTYIPPNQPFKTIEELHMIKGMEDEIYEVLAPNLTLFGGKGININYADKSLLMALDPMITEQVATEIIKRRSDVNLGGPFKDEKDFFSFIGGYGVNTTNFNKDKVPLYFDFEINFNVSCMGLVGNIRREITTVVYDFQKVQARLKKNLDEAGANQQCLGLTDDPKYECLCQNEPDAAAKKKCIDDKKAQDKSGTGQSPEPPLPPGPPYVIFQDVK
jgi:general secretion pathway protein K